MAGVNNRVKITNDIELKDRLVAINRVTKVTKGGRTFSFSAIVVVGNEEGIIGWGLGKAGEVTAAIAKGVDLDPGLITTSSTPCSYNFETNVNTCLVKLSVCVLKSTSLLVLLTSV